MKVHLGCGSVYLREWVNVDLPLPTVFLAKSRTDLVEKWITTEDLYYARHADKTIDVWRGGATTKETVCDTYGAFNFIPARPGSVSEILARQVFEHLDREQAKQGLRQAHMVLKSGGLLRIDVPDPDETVRKYGETGDEFYLRHLFGPRLDEYGYHVHYSRKLLTQFVQSFGFRFVHEEQNIHTYPAFCLRFAKVT